MIPALTFRQLRALQAVADHGSFSGAAEALRLTAPGVHTQLKNLENLTQAALLDRSTPGALKLAPAGRLLVASAQRIESDLSKTLRDIDALGEGRIGQVRLGVVSTGKYFAPMLVARLKRASPDVEIILEIGNREQIITMLKSRSLHLAIMGRPPREPLVTSEVIGPHPHVLIAAPDHPLANARDIPDQTLLKETFILREEGSGTRILMNRYLDRIGEGAPFASIVMGSNETIKQAVIAGLGIAMISQHTVIEELRSGRLVQLAAQGLPILRNWYLLYPTEAGLSPAANRIHGLISETQGDFLPEL